MKPVAPFSTFRVMITDFDDVTICEKDFNLLNSSSICHLLAVKLKRRKENKVVNVCFAGAVVIGQGPGEFVCKMVLVVGGLSENSLMTVMLAFIATVPSRCSCKPATRQTTVSQGHAIIFHRGPFQIHWRVNYTHDKIHFSGNTPWGAEVYKRK